MEVGVPLGRLARQKSQRYDYRAQLPISQAFR